MRLLLTVCLIASALPAHAATGLSSVIMTNLNLSQFIVNLSGPPTNYVRLKLNPTQFNTNITTGNPDGVTITNVSGFGDWTNTGSLLLPRDTQYAWAFGPAVLKTTSGSGQIGEIGAHLAGTYQENLVWARAGTLDALTFDSFGPVNPEGFAAAKPGSVWRNTSAGTLWVKETGSGDTGWVQLSTATINPTDNYLPYRQNATTFGDAPWYRIASNEMGFNATDRFLYSANDNVTLGTLAGRDLAVGPSFQGVFIGTEAGLSNIVTTGNVSIGYLAGRGTTNGNFSVVIGPHAGEKGVINNNVIVGAYAGSQTYGMGGVTLVGDSAGYKNTSDETVAIGGSSLFNHTSGIKNVALGYETLKALITGHDDTASGYRAGLNHTGNYSTFLGSEAGLLTIAGDNNTAVGYLSLGNGTTPSNSTAVGSVAGYNANGDNNVFLGQASGYYITSGNRLVLIGVGAGGSMTDESDNIAIGFASGTNQPGVTNSIAIGNSINGVGTKTTNSNEIVIGNTNNTKVIFPITSYTGAGTLALTDDGTYKSFSTGGTTTITDSAGIGADATLTVGTPYTMSRATNTPTFRNLTLTNLATTDIGVVINGFSGQTNALQTWNNGGTNVAKMDNLGTLLLANSKGLMALDDTDTGIQMGTGNQNQLFFKAGGNTIAGVTASGLSVSANAYFGLGSAFNPDTFITRDSAAVIQQGLDAASPVAQRYKGPDGSGTDKNSGGLTFDGGQPTGTGSPKRVWVKTTTTSASSALTNQPYTDSFSLGGSLKVNTTTTGNIGAGEDDLISYALTAGQISVNGDYLEFDTFGTFDATANTKQLKVYFGGTAIMDSTSLIFNGLSWRVHGKIIRTSATAQKATAEMTVGGVLLGALTTTITSYTTPAETLANAITFKVTGQDTGGVPANDAVVQQGMIVKFYPNGN